MVGEWEVLELLVYCGCKLTHVPISALDRPPIGAPAAQGMKSFLDLAQPVVLVCVLPQLLNSCR